LIGHAAGVEVEDWQAEMEDGAWVARRWRKVVALKQTLGLDAEEDFSYERRYDDLWIRFRKRHQEHRVVRALQLRALRILLRRAGRPAALPLPNGARSALPVAPDRSRARDGRNSAAPAPDRISADSGVCGTPHLQDAPSGPPTWQR
jgi:hypothetical protein